MVLTLEDNSMLQICGGELPTKAHEHSGQTDSSLLTALEARKIERCQSRFLRMPAHLPPVSLQLWWLLLSSEAIGLCVHSPISTSWPHKEQKALPSITTIEGGLEFIV